MCSNFLLSAIMQDFHYLSLSAIGCVGIAYNCSQYIDSSLGLSTDISPCQGTWQFIAGDIIDNPNIVHTFAHDLESFFWVLLWIILTQVQTNMEQSRRSDLVHNIMNPKIVVNSRGQSKTFFVMAEASLASLEIPGNEALRGLITSLHSTVADRYKPVNQIKLVFAPEQYQHPRGSAQDKGSAQDGSAEDKGSAEDGSAQDKGSKDKSQTENKDQKSGMRQGFMKDHVVMLGQFDHALRCSWPSDDGPKNILGSLPIEAGGSSRSRSSKRSRSVNDTGRATSKVKC